MRIFNLFLLFLFCLQYLVFIFETELCFISRFNFVLWIIVRHCIWNIGNVDNDYACKPIFLNFSSKFVAEKIQLPSILIAIQSSWICSISLCDSSWYWIRFLPFLLAMRVWCEIVFWHHFVVRSFRRYFPLQSMFIKLNRGSISKRSSCIFIFLYLFYLLVFYF